MEDRVVNKKLSSGGRGNEKMKKTSKDKTSNLLKFMQRAEEVSSIFNAESTSI